MEKSNTNIYQLIGKFLLDYSICAWFMVLLATLFKLPFLAGIIGAAVIVAIYSCLTKISLGSWFFCTNKESLGTKDYIKILIGVILIILIVLTFFM